MIDNHFDRISEIAIRNEMPVLQVAGIYTGVGLSVYAAGVKQGEKLQLHNPRLKETTYRLTERYIDKQRIGKLNKLDGSEQFDKPYHIAELIGEDKYNHYF
jgi:phosphatidate phosphatase APP1